MKEEARSPAALPDAPEFIAQRVDALLDRHRTHAARDILRDALQRDPHHADLLYQAARTEYLDENHDEAVDRLQALLARQPQHQGARFLLCHVLMARGDLPGAEEMILALLHESPQQPAFYATYARVMLRALHFTKASQLADEALHLSPNDPSALSAKALCELAQGRTGKDNEAVLRLLVQRPDDNYTLRLVMLALVHANRHREAHQVARQLLRAHPHDPSLLENVLALKQLTHWSMLPLWPMQRWGWAGSAGLWVAVLLAAQWLGRMAPAYSAAFTGFWLGFVVYSWAWPPLLKRWIQKQAR